MLYVAAAFIGVVLLVLFMHMRPKNYPPGPLVIPFVGTLNAMFDKNKTLWEYASELGQQKKRETGSSTVSISVANVTPAVIVSDIETFTKCLKNNAAKLNSRNVIKGLAGNGIVQASGSHWKATRKFSVRAMKEFGMGREWLVPSIVQEAQNLFKGIDEAGGELDPAVLCEKAVTNVVTRLIFGKSLAYEDEEFKKIMGIASADLTSDSLGLRWAMEVGSKIDFEKVMSILAPSLLKVLQDFLSVISANINEARAKFDPMDPKSVLDLFLQHEQSEGGSKEDALIKDQAVWNAILLDLYGAGVQTTVNNLRWGLNILASHPQVQATLAAHLQEHLGPNGDPTLKSIHEMHYLNAFLHEVTRFASLVWTGVEHVATEPVEIDHYTVPAGTLVYVNQHAIMWDPRHWEHPEDFRPEHFLDKDGRFTCPPSYMPFGWGRRQCPGQQLAETELAVFLVKTVQRYEIRPLEGQTVDLRANPFDFLRTPRACTLRFTKRE